MSELTQALSLGNPIDALNALSSLLLTFLLTSVIAAFYRWTYQGLSYSRPFVHTIILSSLVTCTLIMAIGNNMARGLGILGTLAIVRFRTPVRDPRDIIFLFCAIGTGIACGSFVYAIAVMGSLFFCLVAWYLHISPFGSRREYEGLLRFSLPRGSPAVAEIEKFFEMYCSDAHLVALREAAQGELNEHAYQVRLRDPSFRADLLDALHAVEDISEVSLLMQRSTVEI
jgi:uncharacterized membrane protein YhiD involved in acid resistance